MNETEANKLLHSIDGQTMQAAKDLMTKFLPAMKGGKWDTLTTNQKICVLVAFALKLGEKKGATNEKNRAEATGGNA